MKKIILALIIISSCKQDKYVDSKGVYEIKETCLDGYYTSDIHLMPIGNILMPQFISTWHCTKSRIDTNYIYINK